LVTSAIHISFEIYGACHVLGQYAIQFKYLIKLFQICWTWQHLQNKCS